MQFDQLRRREFITLLGCAAATWPLGARAQRPEQMRRIGVLMSLAADDPEGKARLAAFVQRLQELGWSDGRNVRIDYRWGVAMPSAVATRRNSSRSRPTSSCPYRSCLQRSLTPSAPAWSLASRGRAATPPALRVSNTASAGNGWSCSSKLRLARRERGLCGTPP